MSEQKAEPTSAESGSLGAGLAVSGSPEAPSQPAALSEKEKAPEAGDVTSPRLASEQGGADETPRMDAPKVDAQKPDASKPDAAKADAPRMPGNITIMSAGDRAGSAPEAEQGSGMFGKRRLAALAAVVALAAVAGALGGALATAGVGHFLGDGATTSANTALEVSVARIDADILALKANLEQTSKTDLAQFNKTSDRLDKVEKAQTEPAVKLAKLSEAVDKLRAAPSVASAPAATAARDICGTNSRRPRACVGSAITGKCVLDFKMGTALKSSV